MENLSCVLILRLLTCHQASPHLLQSDQVSNLSIPTFCVCAVILLFFPFNLSFSSPLFAFVCSVWWCSALSVLCVYFTSMYSGGLWIWTNCSSTTAKKHLAATAKNGWMEIGQKSWAAANKKSRCVLDRLPLVDALFKFPSNIKVAWEYEVSDGENFEKFCMQRKNKCPWGFHPLNSVLIWRRFSLVSTLIRCFNRLKTDSVWKRISPRYDVKLRWSVSLWRGSNRAEKRQILTWINPEKNR